MKYKVKDHFKYVQGVQECRIIRFVFKLLKWAQKELKKEQKEIKYTAGRKKVDQQKSTKAKTVKINYRNQNNEHIHGPGDLSKWKRGKDMDDIIGKKILKNTKKED